jgi:D-3-phosphoglycerate dehydrogenase
MMAHYAGKKLSCLAIGDYMIPSAIFDSVLGSSSLFSHYHSIQWQEGMNGTRAEFRNVVRQVEAKGYKSYPVPDDIINAVEDVDVLFLHLFPVSGELIRRANHLQYIMTARGGLENIDIKVANELNVKVINCPEHNALAVAEYTVGLILDEMRNISRSNMALKAGIWRESYNNSQAIPELNTSMVGLFGFGVIGKLVAKGSGHLMPKSWFMILLLIPQP